MTIRHHPDISTLMSCAAGSQPEAIAAVMAAHISMCPACAAELRKLEEIGAALFEGLEPSTVTRSAPVAAARSGEGMDARTVAARAGGGDVPAPLVALVGPRLAGIPWKKLAPGVWHYPLPLSEGAEGDLRLLKVAPGKALPEHGHGGTELTLLLEGSYHDKVGEFRTGDVADLDEDVEHQPIADKDTGCICLVASERKARFKSFFARLVQPLIGI
jgi:putative transcriptional regulator